MMVVLVHLAAFSFLHSFAMNRLMRSEIKIKKTKHRPLVYVILAFTPTVKVSGLTKLGKIEQWFSFWMEARTQTVVVAFV